MRESFFGGFRGCVCLDCLAGAGACPFIYHQRDSEIPPSYRSHGFLCFLLSEYFFCEYSIKEKDGQGI